MQENHLYGDMGSPRAPSVNAQVHRRNDTTLLCAALREKGKEMIYGNLVIC